MEAHFNFNLRGPNWYYMLLICIHLLMRVVEVFFFLFPPLDLFPEPGGLLYLLQIDFSLNTPSSRKPFLPFPPPAHTCARTHTRTHTHTHTQHTHSHSPFMSPFQDWEEPRNVFTWLRFLLNFQK